MSCRTEQSGVKHLIDCKRDSSFVRNRRLGEANDKTSRIYLLNNAENRKYFQFLEIINKRPQLRKCGLCFSY